MSEEIKNIIWIDDEADKLVSYSEAYSKRGISVQFIRTLTRAKRELQERASADNLPDAILLDIMMPDIDGYEVCKHIKSSTRHEQTKVVFLSAKSKKSDIDKGLNMGADLYVTKPFSTRHLMKEVETLLNKES